VPDRGGRSGGAEAVRISEIPTLTKTPPAKAALSSERSFGAASASLSDIATISASTLRGPECDNAPPIGRAMQPLRRWALIEVAWTLLWRY
jgi:hypothetical protein